MTAKKNTDVARILLQKAKEDEATIALIEAADGPWGVGCFHCQQAAEKRLKAVLAVYQGEFPRTHDIGMLVSLTESHCEALKGLPDEVLLLGDYAVAVRYDDMIVADRETFKDNQLWLCLIQEALATLNMEEKI